eukprot:8417131-Pyramimonas_sp.AAC.1
MRARVCTRAAPSILHRLAQQSFLRRTAQLKRAEITAPVCPGGARPFWQWPLRKTLGKSPSLLRRAPPPRSDCPRAKLRRGSSCQTDLSSASAEPAAGI